MTGSTIANKYLKTAVLCVLTVFLGAAAVAGSAYAAPADYEPFSMVHDGRSVAGTGYMYRGTPYIPLDTLRACGKTDTYTAELQHTDGARLSMDLSKLNLYIGDGETTKFIKRYGGTVHIPLRRIDGVYFAPLNTATQFSGLAYTLRGSTLYMTSLTDASQVGRIAGDGVQGLSSLVEGDGLPLRFTKGDVVFVRRTTPTYYQVETLSGDVAYILQSDLHMAGDDERLLDFYRSANTKPDHSSAKINLAWHYAGTVSPAAPPANGGIDVLAPTWFDQIVEGDGNISNVGDLGYTRTAHENGYFVWATITNNMSTKGSTNYTTKVLADTALRNKTIAQYLFYASLYEIDGINIDYEDVRDADRNGLTAFVKEMRTYTERLGLTLSIATLIPKPWTVEYDYEALGKAVDYITVMTYDEHYSSSPAAGSVSSLPWVDTAIRDLLDYVGGHKVLMGIPLYARLWTVSAAGKPVANRALTMSGARSVIESNNLVPEWLPSVGQYYAEYPNDTQQPAGSHTDKIWLEDARSVAGRLALIYKYNLAGSACWQYTQGEDAVWNVFEAVYRKGVSPGYFTAPY